MEDAYQKASQNLKNQGFDLTNFYVLDAHAGDPSGLGVVARRCSDLSQIVANSQGIAGKVLVPGRPDLYYKLVRRENINYIWTTFESNQLPNHWVEAINRYFTEVFVPHLSVLQVFQNSGVKRPITVLPQGNPRRLSGCLPPGRRWGSPSRRPPRRRRDAPRGCPPSCLARRIAP